METDHAQSLPDVPPRARKFLRQRPHHWQSGEPRHRRPCASPASPGGKESGGDSTAAEPSHGSDVSHGEVMDSHRSSQPDQLAVDFPSLYTDEYFIQELCWDGDGRGFEDKVGIKINDYYRSLFTIKRWPLKTYPGIVHRLTAFPFLDYQITINLEPIPVREEINREEKAIDRLRGDYEEEGKFSMSVALKKKERKIDSLAQGFSFPFFVEYVIRFGVRPKRGCTPNRRRLRRPRCWNHSNQSSSGFGQNAPPIRPSANCSPSRESVFRTRPSFVFVASIPLRSSA